MTSFQCLVALVAKGSGASTFPCRMQSPLPFIYQTAARASLDIKFYHFPRIPLLRSVVTNHVNASLWSCVCRIKYPRPLCTGVFRCKVHRDCYLHWITGSLDILRLSPHRLFIRATTSPICTFPDLAVPAPITAHYLLLVILPQLIKPGSSFIRG